MNIRHNRNTSVDTYKCAVGIFTLRKNVEAALFKLRKEGFSSRKVWLFANGWMFPAIEEEGLVDVLAKRGIPQDKARFYNSRLLQGQFLLLIENLEDKIYEVQMILSEQGVQNLNIYEQQQTYW
jgi:hypothetical protein